MVRSSRRVSMPRWGELHVCSVGEVVGPPYSLESISPGSGAITGNTKVTVSAMGNTTHFALEFSFLCGEITGLFIPDEDSTYI